MRIDPTTKRVIIEKGDIVMIRHGHTRQRYRTGKVLKVSPTQRLVTVSTGNVPRSFYYQGGNDLWRESPGSGFGGAFLNDYFSAADVGLLPMEEDVKRAERDFFTKSFKD